MKDILKGKVVLKSVREQDLKDGEHYIYTFTDKNVIVTFNKGDEDETDAITLPNSLELMLHVGFVNNSKKLKTLVVELSDGVQYPVKFKQWEYVLDKIDKDVECKIQLIKDYDTTITWHQDRLAATINPPTYTKVVKIVKTNTNMKKDTEFVNIANEYFYQIVPDSQVWYNRKYKHYKGGEYVVLNCGNHSETLESCVIYQSTTTNKIWIRPYNMFIDFVEVNGEKIKRFELVEEIKK